MSVILVRAVNVEVWDPSSEGPWIVGQLRQAGFAVRAIRLADIPFTRASLLLMAGDADGALGALKRLRDDGDHGAIPVVLLGPPPGAEHRGEGPGFGADAVFTRPVSFEPLLECVRRLLEDPLRPSELSRVSAPPVERTMRLSSGEADSSRVMVRTPNPVVDEPAPHWRPPEPTMRLDDAEDPAVEVVSSVTRGPAPDRDHASGDESLVSERRSSRSSSLDTGARSRAGARMDSGSRSGTIPPGTDAPQPVIPPEQRAELSPWLHELLSAADRRVFPDRARLALHFPAANEPPESLVPPELFDAGAVRLDEPVAEDPIDAFTFVGGPAVPPPVHGGPGLADDPDASEDVALPERGRTAAEVPQARLREQTTATEPREDSAPGSGVHRASAYPMTPAVGEEWPADDPVLGRPTPEGRRRGTLGPGDAVRLFWRLATLGLDAVCEFSIEENFTAELTFVRGELRVVRGPVAGRVLEGLWRRGRVSERPADEAEADTVLRRCVETGQVGRFERDQLMREAREELLVRIVAAPSAQFELRRIDDTEPARAYVRGRALSRPVRAAVVEAARRSFSVEQVREFLGHGPFGLALGPDREDGLAPAELPSELVELIVRMDGQPLDGFLAAAPTEPGLAGLLYALVETGTLVLTDPRETGPAPPTARASVTRLVEAAAELALEADYFAVLGLSPDASGADVDRAFRARRDELAALPLSALGLGALEGRRDEALEAVEEAHRVLSVPRLRRAYAAAL